MLLLWASFTFPVYLLITVVIKLWYPLRPEVLIVLTMECDTV